MCLSVCTAAQHSPQPLPGLPEPSLLSPERLARGFLSGPKNSNVSMVSFPPLPLFLHAFLVWLLPREACSQGYGMGGWWAGGGWGIMPSLKVLDLNILISSNGGSAPTACAQKVYLGHRCSSSLKQPGRAGYTHPC